eukprot:TRINITY_DN52912_c0_g1_i1.p3 TRINITY_DN52912_c0_g1~~TRINITY_DN52912_c0_g1_i1.p3  ORF type:complete len:111 (-),score=10.57 TRINITY_DN52912_c0_g1_i1:2-334(-)
MSELFSSVLFFFFFSDPGLGDDQFIDVEVVVVLGIGDRRLQAFLDVLGDPALGEGQIGERLFHLLAADHRRQEVQLLRRGLQKPRLRHRFVVRHAAGIFILAHGLLPFGF